MTEQTVVEEQPVPNLKAERVQEELRAGGWTLVQEDQTIERVKEFPTPEVAVLYGAFVSRFASAAGLPVTVSFSGGQVGVSLCAPQAEGLAGELTESVLTFARQI
jgi:hypothetical protein